MQAMHCCYHPARCIWLNQITVQWPGLQQTVPCPQCCGLPNSLVRTALVKAGDGWVVLTRRCVQACLVQEHDLDAALAMYNAGRHCDIRALHKLDITFQARLGEEHAWHPLALAHRFHMARPSAWGHSAWAPWKLHTARLALHGHGVGCSGMHGAGSA